MEGFKWNHVFKQLLFIQGFGHDQANPGGEVFTGLEGGGI